MKKLITVLVLIGVVGYYFYNKKKKEDDYNLEIEKGRFDNKIKDIEQEVTWLKDALEYEGKIKKLYLEMGYDTKRMTDSILAIQDRAYLQDSLRDKDEVYWYKNKHRKDLLHN